MSLNVPALMAGITDPLLSSGAFDRVNIVEPKTAPGSGLTAAVWLTWLGPDPGDSGLAVTSALVVFTARFYTSMISEPQDLIDPAMLNVTAKIVEIYSAGFTLGGAVMDVDLLGSRGHGQLAATAGYINQDGKLMRVMDINIPIIVADAWPQIP